MTSFVNANFGSDSDTDDDDFVPDSSVNPDDSDDEGKAKKRGKLQNPCTSRKVGGIRLEGEEAEDPNDEDEEQRRKEFEKEKEALKEAQETKKIDDLWSDFKKDTSESSKKTGLPLKTTGGGLGTLGSTSKPKSITKLPAVKKKSSESVMSSIFDAFEKKEKGLPNNVLVETEKEKLKQEPKQETSSSLFSSIFEKYEKKSDKDKKEEVKEKEKLDPSTIKITKIFDFAGDSVEVSKEVDLDSKEARKFLKEQEEKEKRKELNLKRPAAATTGGLNKLVSTITNKKPKMGCLDKSKIDWDAYVKDEGIKEELSTFNKGKEGFVEKQMFLERADLRRFEQEKAAREKTRKPLNR